jgi:hypothetical protein
MPGSPRLPDRASQGVVVHCISNCPYGRIMSDLVPDGHPLELIHKDCGHITAPVLTCSRCGRPLHASNVRPVPEPGEVEPFVHTAGREQAG